MKMVVFTSMHWGVSFRLGLNQNMTPLSTYILHVKAAMILYFINQIRIWNREKGEIGEINYSFLDLSVPKLFEVYKKTTFSTYTRGPLKSPLGTFALAWTVNICQSEVPVLVCVCTALTFFSLQKYTIYITCIMSNKGLNVRLAMT